MGFKWMRVVTLAADSKVTDVDVHDIVAGKD